jgi:TRAP-type C4-dicarboxylate transport system permease small subunit
MRKIKSLTYAVAAVSLGIVLCLMTLRILSRNLGLELAGLQLYAQAVGVWMVFIVAGALGLENRHIKVDYFTDRFPEPVQTYHNIIAGLLNTAMCLVIVGGSLLAIREFWTGTSPSVNIPLPVYYVPAVIGLTILSIVYIRRTVTGIQSLSS